MASEFVTLDQVCDRIKKAVEAVLAELPHADYGPVAINGSLGGHILNQGHPETAVGFEVVFGSGLPAGWKK